MKRKIIIGLSAVLLALGLGSSVTPAQAAPAVKAPAANNSVAVAKPKLDMAHPLKGTALGANVKKGAPKMPGAGASPRTQTTCIPGINGACYHWQGGAQGYPITAYPNNITPNASGISANLSIHQPYLALTDWHSLGEIAAMSPDGNFDGTTTGQTIEIGWTVDRALGTVGTSDPKLFVFSWINGVGQNYNGSPWVSVTGCSPCMGDSLSSYVGTSQVFGLTYLPAASPAGWYASFNGSYFAGIPETTWTGLTPPVSFTGIAKDQIFGEIAAKYIQSCTDMGAGVMPGGSPSYPGARIGSYTLYGTTQAADLNEVLASSPASDHTGWNYAYTFSNPVTDMRYGGPGFDSVGYGTGATGSCAPATERDPGTFGSLLTNREYCPDGATTTGCNAVIDLPYASDTINVIHTLPANQQDIVQAWGKFGVSGRAYYLCASSSCASSSRVLVTNALKVNVKAALSGSPHAYERAS